MDIGDYLKEFFGDQGPRSGPDEYSHSFSRGTVIEGPQENIILRDKDGKRFGTVISFRCSIGKGGTMNVCVEASVPNEKLDEIRGWGKPPSRLVVSVIKEDGPTSVVRILGNITEEERDGY